MQEILGYPEINPVFWTLCLEVQFYILYGLMLAVSRNNPAAPLQGVYTIATLSLACLVSLLWPTGVITSSFWPGGFLPLWYAFLVGSAAYWTWKNVVLTPYFIGFLLVLGGFAIFRGDNFAVVSVATAVSLWAAGATQKIYSALGWRWLQWLGAISYSLYLIHNPVTGASFRVGYMLTGSGVIFQAVWWFVSLIACLVAAYLFWRLVERPSMGLAKLILLRGRPGNPSTNVLNVPNRL